MSMHLPKLLLICLAFIWPFGQLFEVPLSHPQIHIYLLDLISLSLLLVVVLNKKNWRVVKKDPLTKPYLIFTSVASFSLLLASFSLSPTDLLISAAYLVRWLVYPGIYFALRIYSKPNLTRHYLLLSLLAFTLLGFLQYFFFPDVRSLFYLGFDDHFYRLVGTLFDPNFTGFVLVVFTLLLLHQPAPQKYLVVLSAIALALTYSRASYLALFVALVYLGLRRFKPIYLVIFALISLSLVFSPKPYGEGVNLLRTFSISSRLEDSRQGLNLFGQKPILGHGFNTLKSIKSGDPLIPSRAQGGFSNSYVFVLVTTGLVGFVAYLYLLCSLYTLLKPSPALTASFISILIHSFFNHSLFYIFILTLLFALASLPKGYRKL
ncbi:MAG: O-Antigen ligase [Microgenomates group bacterium ADurb.Bin238]|nr:MAG: O-Antigen ligase [Microgenomates group bacterium ADurb.Bin238]